MLDRRDMHLIWPACVRRNVCGDAPAGKEQSRFSLLLFRDKRTVQAPFPFSCERTAGAQFGVGYRRDEGVAIDLSMGMVKRHPDGLTTILKDEDIANVTPRSELAVAIRPNIDKVMECVQGKRAEGGVMAIRVDDNFADPSA